ncbi:S-adenosyl-L-methionine-dependent methyltransferase [Xylariales sp. PMI_506]|nr:S-adenosyl-L-methionine-dependent methyltransferase [Xylariales sp. PMI_506]
MASHIPQPLVISVDQSSTAEQSNAVVINTPLEGATAGHLSYQASRPEMEQPPSHIDTEAVPTPDPILSPLYDINLGNDLSFAEVANRAINVAIGRTPTGGSVVKPDSVLGDSGRLYHGYKDGKYFLPNDAAEQDRLDFQHHLISLLLDGWLHLAPMERVPRFVHDVATGTGLWAIEFAERYPSSFVIGTDLSAIQPIPTVLNCVFQKDDAEDEWVFRASTVDGHESRMMFDYVHLRMVSSCFNDPRTVMKHAYDSMSSGGWIEYQDAEFNITSDHPDFEGSPMNRWSKGCIQGAANTGRDVLVPRKYKAWLEEIGFINVAARPLIVPCTPWPKVPKMKLIGKYQLTNLIEGIRGVGWRMLKAAGYSVSDIETLVLETQEYLQNTQTNPYATFWVVYGQKPL